MKHIVANRAAAVTGAALALSSLPLLTLATSAQAEDAPAPTTTYTSKPLAYNCDVSTNLFDDEEDPDALETLDDFPITATVTFALPKLETRGVKLAPVDIGVKLDMGEPLRGASTSFLGAVAADGASTNTVLSLTTDEKGVAKRYYRIPKLAASKADIPLEAGTPWIIDAAGASPRVEVPYVTKTTISAPEQFDIESTIYKNDGSSQPAYLSCDTTGSRAVATVKVGEATSLTATTPSVVKARKAGTVVKVKASSASGRVPQGQIFVYKEGADTSNTSNALKTESVELSEDGTAQVKLPAFGVRGKRTLMVQYVGNATADPKIVKTTFTVK